MPAATLFSPPARLKWFCHIVAMLMLRATPLFMPIMPIADDVADIYFSPCHAACYTTARYAMFHAAVLRAILPLRCRLCHASFSPSLRVIADACAQRYAMPRHDATLPPPICHTIADADDAADCCCCFDVSLLAYYLRPLFAARCCASFMPPPL